MIAISSVPKYNDEARERGVIRCIYKDYKKLDEFANNVMSEVKAMIFEPDD